MQAFHLPIGDATRLDPALTTGCGTTRDESPRYTTLLLFDIAVHGNNFHYIVVTGMHSLVCMKVYVWIWFQAELHYFTKAKAGQTLSPCLCIVVLLIGIIVSLFAVHLFLLLFAPEQDKHLVSGYGSECCVHFYLRWFW